MNILEIKEALIYNIPTLFYGEKGWGKTQLINQVSRELNYECITLLLADVLPEDLSGIPTINKELQQVDKYLLNTLKKVENNLKNGIQTVLFLDEITQCSPQVMNCLYYLIENRRIGINEYPELRIIGATNYDEESDYLSQMPLPLIDRFYITNWVNDANEINKYINNKYNLDFDYSLFLISEIKNKVNFKKTCNPRSIEKTIKYYKSGLVRKEKLIALSGSVAFVEKLLKNKKNKQTSSINDKMKIVSKMLNEGIRIEGTTLKSNDFDYIIKNSGFQFTEEELEVLKC